MHDLEEIKKEEVLKLWHEATHDSLHVYIHSPFCPSLCDYCCYQGVMHNKDDYESYYGSYLPGIIDFYKNVLKRNKIKSWFFGGGTPSLVSVRDLQKIFELLPNFNYGEKSFEIHPAFWSVDQLDLLQNYDFDNIIIGVQSFDSDLLKKVNRVPASFKKIKKLIKEAKRRKFRICLDLILFMDGENRKREISIFKNDIRKALSFNPEELTLQLNFSKDYEKRDSKVLTNSTMSALDDRLDDYFFNLPIFGSRAFKLHLFKMILEKRTWKIIRLIRKDMVDDFENGRFDGFLGQEPKKIKSGNFSLLGIGAYKNTNNYIFDKENNTGKGKVTFSNINIKGEVSLVVETNHKKNPRFFTC